MLPAAQHIASIKNSQDSSSLKVDAPSKAPFIELPEIYSSLRRIRSTLNLEKKATKLKKVARRKSPRAVIDVESLGDLQIDENSKSGSISGASDGTTKEATSNHGSFLEDLLNYVTRSESHHAHQNLDKRNEQGIRKSKSETLLQPGSEFIWEEVHDVRAGDLFYSTLIDSANM